MGVRFGCAFSVPNIFWGVTTLNEAVKPGFQWSNLVVAILIGFFYAYPTWSAIGNLLSIPAYFETKFGAGADEVPWLLLWTGVAAPILIFVSGIFLGWRRGPGSLALVLATGFGLVSAIGLDLIALEKDIEIKIVIDLLNG